MRKKISSDGKNVKIITDGVTQEVSEGSYNANTPLTSTVHSQNGIRESGTSRNVEITGNSQEVYAGRGVTSEYNLKVVGSPELFSGQAQRVADNALSSMAGLTLQTGDNRNSAAAGGLPIPDFKKVVSSMTSSFQNQLAPELPEITRIQDIPIFFAKVAVWFSSLNVANLAETSARAAALEIERQVEQTKITMEKKTKELGENFTLSGITTPATEDKENVTKNITRQDVYDAYVKNIDTILAAQREIG